MTRLRRTTLVVLVLAPIISYCIPAATTLGWFNPTDITRDFSGFLSFLFMLLNPYVGLAILASTQGRSLTRSWVLLVASILIGGFGIFLWYDLLVRDASVFSIFALLGVGTLQWIGILTTGVILGVIWAAERGLARRQVAGSLIVCSLMSAGCLNPPPIPESNTPTPAAEPQGPVDLRTESLMKNLPWAFSETDGPSNSPDSTRILFRSIEPIEETDMGEVYLRASLSTQSFESKERAADAFANRCRDANPDTGLSYAWDLLIKNENKLLHLHADCLFSERAFDTISNNLIAAINQTDLKIFRCRCGGGCANSELD